MRPNNILTSATVETASLLNVGDAVDRRRSIDPSRFAAASAGAGNSTREPDEAPLRGLNPAQVRALRVNDAAALYGLSRSTLYKLMATGVLKSVRVGGRRLIPRDAMEKLIAGGGQ